MIFLFIVPKKTFAEEDLLKSPKILKTNNLYQYPAILNPISLGRFILNLSSSSFLSELFWIELDLLTIMCVQRINFKLIARDLHLLNHEFSKLFRENTGITKNLIYY